MPAPSPQSSSSQNAVILERLDGIITGMGELKTSVACIDKNYQALNTEWNREHAVVVLKVDTIEKRADSQDQRFEDLEAKIETLTATVESLKSRIDLMLWAGGIGAGAVILYIVNNILHTVLPGIP